MLFLNASLAPVRGLAGRISASTFALQPILALAAIVLAIKSRVREALLVFSGMIALAWLAYLPPIAGHGLDLEGGPDVVYVVFGPQIILAPLLALAIAVLAVRNRRLGLATILAVLPTPVGVLWMVAVGIGIAIYGF
jgi:hypothetical protein